MIRHRGWVLLSFVEEGKSEQKEKAAPLGGGSGSGSDEVPVVVSERGVQVFTYKQLHSATGGFGKRSVVGHGSFGAVYRGALPDGRKVAVKLMDRPGKQGEEEFKMEVSCWFLSSPLFHLIFMFVILTEISWRAFEATKIGFWNDRWSC